MQRTLAGYKETGSWEEIVLHGERITVAFQQLDNEDFVENEAFKEWNAWRPKYFDTLENDVKARTAETAATGEGTGEKEGISPARDLLNAGQKLSDTGAEDSPRAAANSMQDSVSYLTRAIDTITRKAIRPVEQFVYKHVMTRVSPCYFDNEIISANTHKSTPLSPTAKGNQAVYTLEVNINDDDLREELIPIVEDVADKPRVDTGESGVPDPDVDSVCIAEGVDL